MKRWRKIAICGILCLTIPVTALAVWQRENLKALYTFLTKDSVTLEREMEDKQKEQQNKLEEEYQITVKPPSTQNNNDLINGVVTPEDVKGELGITDKLENGEKQEEKPTEKPDIKPEEKPPAEEPEKPEEKPEEPAPEEPPPQPELTEEERITKINDLVDRCTAELYACEVDLMAKLGEMKQAAVAEWTALAPEERTNEKKLEIGFAGLDKCYELEVVTNKEVKAILENYRPLLEELGADTAVLDELWLYYCEKKENTKAYYMNKYLD